MDMDHNDGAPGGEWNIKGAAAAAVASNSRDDGTNLVVRGSGREGGRRGSNTGTDSVAVGKGTSLLDRMKGPSGSANDVGDGDSGFGGDGGRRGRKRTRV